MEETKESGESMGTNGNKELWKQVAEDVEMVEIEQRGVEAVRCGMWLDCYVTTTSKRWNGNNNERGENGRCGFADEEEWEVEVEKWMKDTSDGKSVHAASTPALMMKVVVGNEGQKGNKIDYFAPKKK